MREYIIKSKEPVPAEPFRTAYVELRGLLLSEDCSEMSTQEKNKENEMKTEEETFREPLETFEGPCYLDQLQNQQNNIQQNRLYAYISAGIFRGKQFELLCRSSVTSES